MYVRALGVAKCTLVCILLAGCGGLQRNLVYRPRAPHVPDRQAQLGREHNASWQLELSEAEVFIAPVVVSSKLIWVFGPFIAFPTFWEEQVPEEGRLKIAVRVTAKPGASVGFDLRDFSVLLESGRSLSPTAVVPWGSRVAESVEPVTLSGGQTWRGLLAYEVSLTDLHPFSLQLGTLVVNGESFRFPPVPFTPGESYSGD